MRMEELTLTDVEGKSVYYYTNDENTQIEEFKLKEKAIAENSGYFLITGKIKIADGSIYSALLGISSDDSGELFEAYFFVNGKLVSQDDKDFLRMMGKEEGQIFPYKYHLNINVTGDTNSLQHF